MKILFMPSDTASRATITANALNKIENIEAKCLFLNKNNFSVDNPSAKRILLPDIKDNFIGHILKKMYAFFIALKLIIWADVIHYTSDSAFKGIDLIIAKLLRKKGVVEWVGSDIRNPDILKQINPYYAQVFNQGYEYKNQESALKSTQRQERFSKVNFIPLVTHEMSIFINPKLFKKIEIVHHRINTEFFQNLTKSSSNNSKLLIVHSPTARICKGSNYIIQAINELEKIYNFEFKIIENLSRKEALAIVSEADIFIDQIILGTYGFATVEAMSMGKVVIAFIMDKVFKQGLRKDIAIVNANPDNIKKKIEELIKNEEKRKQVGIEAKKQAIAIFDSSHFASQLLKIYSAL